MAHLFPHDHVVAGVLVLLVGFVFHWIGQLFSLINWDLATRLGLQEREMPPEYKVYEHAIAVADVCVGWTYGIAGVGLLLGASWGYKLAWVPGVVLVYHAFSFLIWTGNQSKAGHHLSAGTPAFRAVWTTANLVTGLLAIALAWQAS